MADTKRNVTVNLKILNDPESKESFDQIKQSLEAMEKGVKRNQKAIRDMGDAYKGIGRMEKEARRQWTAGENRGDLIARGDNYGKGGKYTGSDGASRESSILAGKLGGVAAALAAAAPAIARAGHDSFMTGGQKARAIFRDVVPFGSRIQGAFDSFSGRSAGMEMSNFLASQQGVSQQQAAMYAQNALSLNPANTAARERANQLRGASAITMGAIDRSGSAGEREFRERSRLIPVEREIAKNQREQEAAIAGRRKAEEESNKIATRGNKLVAERVELQRKINVEGGSGVNRQNLLNRMQVVNDAIEANRQQKEAAIGVVRDARIGEANAVGATSMSRARFMDEKANILEERAGLAAGQASTLGMMNPFDRARSVDAFQMLQQAKGDTSQLPPEMLNLAMAAGGPAAQKLVEKFGATTSEFSQMQKLAPDVYAGDPEQLRREASAARDEAERARMQAETALAEVASREGARFAEASVRLVTEWAAAAMTTIENRKLLEKNAP